LSRRLRSGGGPSGGRRGEPPRGHALSVWSVAFSPDSTTLVSGGLDKVVRLWDVVNRRPPTQLRGHTDMVRRVGFSPDGKTVISSGDDRTIHVWNVVRASSGGAPLKGHTHWVNSVAIRPD